MDSQNNLEKERTELLKHYAETAEDSRKAGRIGLLELLTNQREQAKNREAESKAVRKHWGDDGAEDVGDIYLGDVKVTNPQPKQKQSGKLKSALIGAGLTAIGGPIAGAAGVYLYDKFANTETTDPAPIVEPVDTDTTVEIRLGRE